MDPISLLGMTSSILGGGGLFGDQSGGINSSLPEQVTQTATQTPGGGAFTVGGRPDNLIVYILIVLAVYLFVRG